MKQIVFLHLFSLLAIGMSAQTKVIAHKSISGSNTSFADSYTKGTSELDGSNFGMAPERRDRFLNASSPQLDTVIFLSKTRAVMITSCEAYKKGGKSYTPSPLWRPGRDTVFNHPLFSKNHSLDSIKDVLKSEYSFVNDIETTVFLGYDNDKQQIKGWKKERRKNKKNALPFVPMLDKKRPPFGENVTLLLMALGILSVLSGVLVNKLSRRVP